MPENPTLPARLPGKDIAKLFNVDPSRISQLVRKGVLRKDADNMISVAEAMAFRHAQVSTETARTLTQGYSNGKTQSGPKVTAFANLSAEDREVLGLDDEPLAAGPSVIHGDGGRLLALRAQKLEGEIERNRIRAARESGELVPREAVHVAGFKAGKLISGILQNVPAEIAAIFAEPERKAEVRAHMQTRIDQVLHALHSALKEHTVDVDPLD